MNELIEGYNTETIESKIENEGLDYFLSSYVDADKIIDDELREAVYSYLDARGLIIHIFEKHGIDIYD